MIYIFTFFIWCFFCLLNINLSDAITFENNHLSVFYIYIYIFIESVLIEVVGNP